MRAKPVRRARAVAVEDIAREAVDVLDEHGIQALSLRSLAGTLRVAPASLYSRISGVDDVLDLALDHALTTDAPFRRALDEVGHLDLLVAYYRHLIAHPWAVTVVTLRPPRGPAYLNFSETLCKRLQQDGVDNVLTTAYAMSNYVLGCAATAQAAAREPHTPAIQERSPLYERLRSEYEHSPDVVVQEGLKALRHIR